MERDRTSKWILNYMFNTDCPAWILDQSAHLTVCVESRNEHCDPRKGSKLGTLCRFSFVYYLRYSPACSTLGSKMLCEFQTCHKCRPLSRMSILLPLSNICCSAEPLSLASV